MKYLNIGRVLLVSLIIYSCSSSANLPSQQINTEVLYQSQWQLTELQGSKLPANSKAYVEFAKGEKTMVSGSTGCNRLTGSVMLMNDHEIKFSPMATTRMACLDESSAAIEKNFLQILASANKWLASDSELVLKNNNEVLARFTAQKKLSSNEAKLNGVWELDFISGSNLSLGELYPEKKPTIIFSFPNMNAGGTSSCNGYGSQVTIDSNHLSFKDPISTMMACPGDGEKVFFSALKRVSAYKMEAPSTLVLLANEEMVMRFKKK